MGRHDGLNEALNKIVPKGHVADRVCVLLVVVQATHVGEGAVRRGDQLELLGRLFELVAIVDIDDGDRRIVGGVGVRRVRIAVARDRFDGETILELVGHIHHRAGHIALFSRVEIEGDLARFRSKRCDHHAIRVGQRLTDQNFVVGRKTVIGEIDLWYRARCPS